MADPNIMYDAFPRRIYMNFEAKQISIPINKPAAEVYEFTSNPKNLPKWEPSFFRQGCEIGYL